MKYKVGDKVRVRSDLVVGENYKMKDEVRSSCGFVTDMKKFCGRIVTIESIIGNKRYLLEEDVEKWLWVDEMFEGLAEEPEFHVYDTVKHEKYGLGTVIGVTDHIIKIDFDFIPYDMHGITDNILYCRSESLTLIEAYTGGEDQ